MQTEIDGSVFVGFKRVLRTGTLVFALILTILFAPIYYQHQRSEESVRSVEHTRKVIAYIHSLRTYLLNLDNAVRKYAESQNSNYLDPSLICRQSPCPSAEQLIALTGARRPGCSPGAAAVAAIGIGDRIRRAPAARGGGRFSTA